MHPVCVALELPLPGDKTQWDLDDKALLEFGEQVLEDLGQGKHHHEGIQTSWGETYGSIPSEVLMKRLHGVIKALRASWEFWSQTRHQVEQWSQRLDNETRVYLRAFLSDKVEFDPSKSGEYMEFVHRLFTSSRATLLLCTARVQFLLSVAPWGETAPGDYDTLRLRAFQALSVVCSAWNMLMELPRTVALWVESACEALRRQESTHESAPDDGHRYDYPEDMIDADEQADFVNTQYSNGEYFQSAAMRDAWDFIRIQPTARDLFDDCYSIDYWGRTHVLMGNTIETFKSIKGGKPFHISVVQDEAAARVSESDARSCTIQLWSSLISKWRNGSPFSYHRSTAQNLKCLVSGLRALDGADDSWWPKEMHKHGEQQHRSWGRAHCEAILCQDWVNRRVRSRRSSLTSQKTTCVLSC